MLRIPRAGGPGTRLISIHRFLDSDISGDDRSFVGAEYQILSTQEGGVPGLGDSGARDVYARTRSFHSDSSLVAPPPTPNQSRKPLYGEVIPQPMRSQSLLQFADLTLEEAALYSPESSASHRSSSLLNISTASTPMDTSSIAADLSSMAISISSPPDHNMRILTRTTINRSPSVSDLQTGVTVRRRRRSASLGAAPRNLPSIPEWTNEFDKNVLLLKQFYI